MVETYAEISARTGITNPTLLKSIQDTQKAAEAAPPATAEKMIQELREEEAKMVAGEPVITTEGIVVGEEKPLTEPVVITTEGIVTEGTVVVEPPAPAPVAPPPSTKVPTEAELSAKYGTTVILSPSHTLMFPGIGDTGVRYDGTVSSIKPAAAKYDEYKELGILSPAGEAQVTAYIKAQETAAAQTVHVDPSIAFITPTTGVQEEYRQAWLEEWNKVEAEAKAGWASLTPDQYYVDEKGIKIETEQGFLDYAKRVFLTSKPFTVKPSLDYYTALYTLRGGGYMTGNTVTPEGIERAVSDMGVGLATTTLKEAGFESPERLVAGARERLETRQRYSEFIDDKGTLDVTGLVASYKGKVPDTVLSDLRGLGYVDVSRKELDDLAWWATATPEEKYHRGVETGEIPKGSLYAGRSPEDKTQPMYYKVTPKQLGIVEKQFLEDSSGAPKYFSNLLKRAGVGVPAGMTDKEWATIKREADEKGIVIKGGREAADQWQKWESLSETDQQKVLSVYYHQATEEEDRVTPISLPKTGMMYLGAVSEAIQRRAAETVAEYLPPGMEMPVIAGVSVVTTIGEMALALPLIVAEAILDPNTVPDIAIGMKDFVVDAGKGVARADPWAIGQMAVIVGTLYLGGKPLVKAVKVKAPAMASAVKVALSKTDTAIRGKSAAAIRKAGAELKTVGRKVRGAEGDALVRLGERVETQAEYLKTASVETIRDIKMQLENAGTGGAVAPMYKGRYQWKPLRKTETISAEDVGMSKAQFDRFIKERVARKELTPEIFKLKEGADFNKMLKEALKTETRYPQLGTGAEGALASLRYLKQWAEVLRKSDTYKSRRFLRETIEPAIKKMEAKWGDLIADLVKETEQTKASEIVRKARENEVRVNAAAEKTLKELEGMTKNSAIVRVLESASTTQLTAMFALGARQMVNTLAALRAKQAAGILDRLDPVLRARVGAVAGTRTRGLTKAETKALTKGLTKTETKALTAVLAKVETKALTKVETKALTEAETKAVAKAETKVATATSTLTKTATETLTKTLTRMAIDTLIASALLTARFVPKKIRIKRKRFVPLIPPMPREDPAKPALAKYEGSVAWQMGELTTGKVFHILNTVKDKITLYEIYVGKYPPKGVRLARGRQKAMDTLKAEGRLPKTMDIDIGATDLQLRSTKEGKVTGKFRPDPKGKTRGDVTAKGAGVTLSGMR